MRICFNKMSFDDKVLETGYRMKLFDFTFAQIKQADHFLPVDLEFAVLLGAALAVTFLNARNVSEILVQTNGFFSGITSCGCNGNGLSTCAFLSPYYSRFLKKPLISQSPWYLAKANSKYFNTKASQKV